MNHNRKRSVLVWILVLLFLVFLLFPFYWMFVTSVKTDAEIYASPLVYWPKEVVWTTYKKLFGYFNFLRYMKNSLVVAVITMILSLSVSLLAAYAFSRYQFRGRKLLMCIFLSNNMFPTVLLMIPLYSIMRQIGLLYTPGALVLSYTTFTIPFTIWLLQGFIRDFPFSLEEAALVDGCSRLTAFFHVFLPIMKQCLNVYQPPDKDHTSGPQQPDRTAGGGVGYAVCWRHGCHPSCVRHVLLCTEEAGGRADRRGCEGLGKVRGCRGSVSSLHASG